MQTWAKRGIQTALMTGGMLALGAGIAAAAENCEQRPCSPLDGGVRIPINVDNNVVGTPVGQKDLPSVHREIGTDQIAAGSPKPVAPPGGTGGGQDPSRGNHGTVNVVAPVDVSGNAIALGGDAETHNVSHQEATYNEPIHTDGDGGTLAGNAFVLALAMPIQLDGNAVALLGNARSYNSSSQRAIAGSGVTTSGDGGTLCGNVLAGQFALPVQGNGNAIALVGNSDSHSTSESGAYAPGALSSSGDQATGSGNVLGVPVGVPLGVNGNALSVVGNSRADTETEAKAIAGGTVPGRFGGPAYVRTSGNDSTLSGNGGELPVSGPVEVDGNALAAVGNAVSRGSSDKYTRAGGGVSTGGTESTVSGSVLEGPVALPTQVFGNAGSVIGNSDADYCNATRSRAGGATYTNGDRSVLSGDGAVVPPAGAADVFGNGVSVIGNSSGHGANDTDVSTGGYNGTTGNDAVGSGNVVTTPVALPVEGFGLAGSVLGNATGHGEEIKKIHSGNGDTDTNDDGGTLSSNVVGVAIAAPVQVFGDAAGVIANVRGSGWNETTATAGRDTQAKGTKGTGSGNIGYVPVSLPMQVFGVAGTVIGNAEAVALNETHSTAGGDADTDGVGGSGSGNVLAVPVAGAVQVFGDALSVVGIASGVADNTTTSTAGGDIRTSGEDGSLAGNILQVPVTLEALVFGNAATVGGIARGVGVNDLRSQAGGSTSTAGPQNALSGTVAGEPVNVLVKIYNVPIEIVGHAMAEGRDRGEAVGQEEPHYLDVPTVGERLGAADIP